MSENEKDTYVLAVDFGTQSVRASIFDKDGNCLCMEQEKYEPAYVSSKPGYAEQDPDHYFDEFCDCSKRLAVNYPFYMDKVGGLTISCFRDTAVCLDEKNQIVRPSILWLDQRMAKCEKPLSLLDRAIFRVVGMHDIVRMNRKRSMPNWMKENEPENWAKTKKYIAISTYFIFKLTGEMKDAASNYTGHYPLNYKKKVWYKNPMKNLRGQVFGVDEYMLPELIPAGELAGTITLEAALQTGLKEGLKVFAGGSDKSCETLGAGVVDDSILSISLGTACTVETTTDRYVEPVPLFPEYPSVSKGKYNMDFQIYRGFWMINWFLKEFAGVHVDDVVLDELDPTEFNEKLNTIPAGSDGLMLQPFWGSNLDKPEVKGMVIGFSDSTTQYHFYKAIIEGIAYELRAGAEGFQKQLRHGFKEIRISGGGGKSDEICQIFADVFNLPVSKMQTIELSSLGAAASCFVSLGIYKNDSEAVLQMCRKSKTFEPNQDNAAVYNELYNKAYKKLFPKLKPIYKYLYNYCLANRKF